ncbi:MAG: ParA family protein [Candidatus Hodarchaeales archaeon]|jgi:MinD-like ATPase involved in chromosome partitioning or flagellar assembly
MEKYIIIYHRNPAVGIKMEKILIHSYKGGTGKTTVAVNLASILSHDKRILLLENDFNMPCFINIFKYEPEFCFNDYFKEKVNLDKTIQHDIKPNLDVIFADKRFDPTEKIMGSDQKWYLKLLKRMMSDLKSLESKYDYVIFDTPPGWHLILVNLIALANKAILLLRPNSYEVNGTKQLLEILYKRAKPMVSFEVHLIFNQVPEVNMETDLKDWAKDLKGVGVKYAGFISCSCNTAFQMAHEKTIFTLDHEFSQALLKILKKIN